LPPAATRLSAFASYDLAVLRERYGYIHEGRVLDTHLLYILYHYAEDGDRTEIQNGKWRLPDPTKTKAEVEGSNTKVGMTSLLYVAKRFLPDVELDKSNQGGDWSAPELPPEMLAYSLKDAAVLLPLSDALVDSLEGIGMGKIIDLEARALPAKIWMERNGMPVDAAVAREMGEKYAREAEGALSEMIRLLPKDAKTTPDGEPWAWTNPNHVRMVLEAFGVDLGSLEKTGKTGEPSTARSSLSKVKAPGGAVQWIEAYLSYKDLLKRSNDFVNKYAELVRENGTIVGAFETISTGRYNCVRPNLQQVPKRGRLQTLEGMRIRDIFRARDGEKLVVADFEQVELLLAATIAERESGTESRMLEVFRSGGDIHQSTAATVLGKSEEAVSGEERTLAKAINFGLIYGCSAETLLDTATNTYGIKDMKLRHAKKYRRAFFEKYPEFVAWHGKVKEACTAGREYATTPLGRRRKLPKWAKSGDLAFTTAVNHPVQGAGADAMKLTLAKIFERRNQISGRPELNGAIHDEAVLSALEEAAEDVCAWVGSCMAEAEREAVLDPKSPIAVEVESRRSWGGG
jgi:DNA polymerase I-like protein with 3'-5' exonuclease and polymerase domains